MIEKEKFKGIILAAGFSTRMNEWKLEIKIEGIPIVVHTINSMLPFCETIIVTGGFNYQNLVKLIYEEKYFSEENKKRIQLVENKEYMNGMLSSVKTGLSFLIDNFKGVFILPGDMPFVRSKTYSLLINNFENDNVADIFIPVTKIKLPSENEERNKKGHPILIRQRIFNNILNDEDEIILRDLLRKFEQKLCPVEDKGIIIDVDDKTDLEKAKIYYQELLISERGNK